MAELVEKHHDRQDKQKWNHIAQDTPTERAQA
jgi:hypothetical protein